MTSREFAAWAEGCGWTVLARRPAVVTAMKGQRRCTWERQAGGWWKMTERRGRRGGADQEEA